MMIQEGVWLFLGDCYRKRPACIIMHCLRVAFHLEHYFGLLQLHLFALHCCGLHLIWVALLRTASHWSALPWTYCSCPCLHCSCRLLTDAYCITWIAVLWIVPCLRLHCLELHHFELHCFEHTAVALVAFQLRNSCRCLANQSLWNRNCSHSIGGALGMVVGLVGLRNFGAKPSRLRSVPGYSLDPI